MNTPESEAPEFSGNSQITRRDDKQQEGRKTMLLEISGPPTKVTPPQTR